MFEERERGGGSGTQKLVFQKMAQINISVCKFPFLPQSNWVQGEGGGGAGDPELLEAPKTVFGLNCLALKAPEKIFDWLKARRNICPIT